MHFNRSENWINIGMGLSTNTAEATTIKSPFLCIMIVYKVYQAMLTCVIET